MKTQNSLRIFISQRFFISNDYSSSSAVIDCAVVVTFTIFDSAVADGHWALFIPEGLISVAVDRMAVEVDDDFVSGVVGISQQNIEVFCQPDLDRFLAFRRHQKAQGTPIWDLLIACILGINRWDKARDRQQDAHCQRHYIFQTMFSWFHFLLFLTSHKNPTFSCRML